ncbi:hypothetical protein ZWY2020_027446 [Hordeum vulgare]|nr:hypothetical protein ZWY2020_027446 [Hordeum vulgare]
MTKGQTSKLEAKKKKGKAASSPAGRVDPGDFLLHGDGGEPLGVGGARMIATSRGGCWKARSSRRLGGERLAPHHGTEKTCKMGTAYETLRAEKVQFARELDAAMVAMAGMKDVLAEREKSLEQAREANKALTAEVEKMGKQRTELMGQMKLMNKACIAQENYVSDWARKMIALLGDFCMDVEVEAADVERSMLENIPLGEDANRDLLRAHIRLGKVGPFIGRLREVVDRINKELWPEDESQHEMEGLMTRRGGPNRKVPWKKSAARGA